MRVVSIFTLLSLLVSVSAFAAAIPAVAPAGMGTTTLWTCDGNGIKSLTVKQTSGVTVSYQGKLVLESGDSEDYTLTLKPHPRNLAGGNTEFFDIAGRSARFNLSIYTDGTPLPGGLRSATLKASVMKKNARPAGSKDVRIDQSVTCKR